MMFKKVTRPLFEDSEMCREQVLVATETKYYLFGVLIGVVIIETPDKYTDDYNGRYYPYDKRN